MSQLAKTIPSFSLTDKQKELRSMCSGAQKNLLVYGGSRSGKTFFVCYAFGTRAIMAPGSRHVIFRKHGVAVKQSIGMDTFPKMMDMAYPQVPIKWHDKDGYFSFPNKSEVWLAGLDDKERVDKVLGKEFSSLYFNEASEIALSSYTVAQTRLAQKVYKVNGDVLPLKNYVDLNPTTRQHWTYRLWIDGVNPDGENPVDPDDYNYMVVNPFDNKENLSPDYLKSLGELPERARKRFFLGEFSADIEHALWRRESIKRIHPDKVPDLTRIIVAIDPAVSNDVGSDETGIVCGGVDKLGQGYLLADDSGKYRPEDWARRAIALYHQFGADRIVAEVNQGGDMVQSVLKTQFPNVPYTAVHATRGKVIRAEPIAALYERGKVYHAGEFNDLESQMCSFTTDFDRKAQGYSPDRVDALVWLWSQLFPKMVKKPNFNPIRRKEKPRFF